MHILPELLFCAQCDLNLTIGIGVSAQETFSIKKYVFTLWLAFSVIANLLWTTLSDPGVCRVIGFSMKSQLSTSSSSQ